MRTALYLLLIGALACAHVQAGDVTCTWGECDEECDGGRRRCDRSNGKVWNIDCHKQACEPFDGCGKADVVFVFDSSASIGERNWWVTKQFAIDIIKGLNIDVDESRIGAVIYSENAETMFVLGDHDTKDALEDAIWDFPWFAETTNTYEGLQHAEAIFTNYGRAEVKHIVVLITDGESNIRPSKTIPQAEAMHNMGIEIFAIGIGNVNEDEIYGIASELKDAHMHLVDDYSALTAITNTVINDTCRAANLSECGPWSDWSTECVFDDIDKQCGPGSYQRSRECKFYMWEGGPYQIRIHTEYKTCWPGPTCPPTTPPTEPDCDWSDCSSPCGGGTKTCDRGGGKIWTIPCNVQECNPEFECDKADVTFLLDSSASIGEKNWWRTKQFAIDVMKGLPVEKDKIRIGTVTFSRHGLVQWGLTDSRSYDPWQMEPNLWNLAWLKKTTHTAEGLMLARQTTEASTRADIPKIVIVMTDGQSNVRRHHTIPEAQLLHDAGYKVFCIAVRETGSAEFEAIASDPNETFLHSLKDYDALTDITNIIVEQTCMAARGMI